MKTKVTINGVEYNIDLEKAKELGLVETVNSRCKSWEEYRKKYKNYKGVVLMSDITDNNECYFIKCPIRTSEQLTKEEAIAITAFSKLLKLRRDWIGDWKPDWYDTEKKFYIEVSKNKFYIDYHYNHSRTFCFPTEAMAKEFFECFKELFEQCKYLI